MRIIKLLLKSMAPWSNVTVLTMSSEDKTWFGLVIANWTVKNTAYSVVILNSNKLQEHAHH